MNKTQSRDLTSKRPAIDGTQRTAGPIRNAKQRHQHYLTLAHERASAGDRIEAENYYQHAEHYFRCAAELVPFATKAERGK
jgi:hypothetical protein